jgi:hypothetical protein
MMRLGALYRRFILAAVVFGLGTSLGCAADIESMTTRCSARAVSALHVGADAVDVKYEGQRTDKSHAVNGSAVVRGENKIFQCSFERSGRRITQFVVNAGQSGGASTSQGVEEKGAAPETRAGAGDFDATGQVPCAQPKGQPMAQCNFGVSRAGRGTPQSSSLLAMDVSVHSFSKEEKP